MTAHRQGKFYEERVRDIDRDDERRRHDQKMHAADVKLDQHERKLKSARRLYEERAKDD